MLISQKLGRTIHLLSSSLLQEGEGRGKLHFSEILHTHFHLLTSFLTMYFMQKVIPHFRKNIDKFSMNQIIFKQNGCKYIYSYKTKYQSSRQNSSLATKSNISSCVRNEHLCIQFVEFEFSTIDDPPIQTYFRESPIYYDPLPLILELFFFKKKVPSVYIFLSDSL